MLSMYVWAGEMDGYFVLFLILCIFSMMAQAAIYMYVKVMTMLLTC